MEKTGIQQAVDAMAAKAEGSRREPQDGNSELARAIDVTPQAVSSWVRLGYVPVGRARQVELVSGIDRRKLVDPVIRDLFE